MRSQAKPFAIEVRKQKKSSKGRQQAEHKGWADAYLAPAETMPQPPVEALPAQGREISAAGAGGIFEPVASRILPDLTALPPTLAQSGEPPRVSNRKLRKKKSEDSLRPSEEASGAVPSRLQLSLSPTRYKIRVSPEPIKSVEADEPAKILENASMRKRQTRLASRWRTAGALHPGEQWKRRLPHVCR